MIKSPTALNKRGNKVVCDGYKFDSEKEYLFYERFVKGCSYPFEVHTQFVLEESEELREGKIRSVSYTPDFIIKNSDGSFRHVIDVKNSFGIYGIDAVAKLKFNLFARKYKHPVEAVVIRTRDFKVITQSVTKGLNEKKPFITDNFNYHWLDATNY